MKVKKVISLIIGCIASFMHAGTVHHTMVSTTEQKMLGHMFKHVMTSGSTDKDEYFIDGYPIPAENYHKEFERIQRKEWEELALQQENQRRSRLQFSEMIQVEIAAKLLQNIVIKINDLLDHVYNPVLENFFEFNDTTIDSIEQLNQLKLFVNQVQNSMKSKSEQDDFERLNLLYMKLENWPIRLEKFYQNTVQKAIRKSDDTTTLKELLKLVAEPFGTE